MQTVRHWRWLAIGAGLLALAWGVFTQLNILRARGELHLAQKELGRGELEAAHRRLTSLAANPGTLGGSADYWLGICESLVGRTDAALRAFARVPAAFAFEQIGAYHEAKANLAHGRLRPAEQRLEKALVQPGPIRGQIRALLRRVYEIEVRFDDVTSLNRASLAVAEDPLRDLKELSNFDLRRLPYDGLKAALEEYGQLAPGDDRVWLGKARLAIEAGRWDDANEWLMRCRRAVTDPPVWRAVFDWARGSGRPDKALEAARKLGSAGLGLPERMELRAWLDRLRGDVDAESASLELWLRIDPSATRALERLAELAHRAGQTERVAELRRRQSSIEQAIAAYRQGIWRDEPPRTGAERSELAQRAEAAGRRHEARALYAWALKTDPGDSSARERLAKLDREDTERRQLARTAEIETLPEPGPPAHVDPETLARGLADGVAFTDDAQAVGLEFTYDNPETSLHQLPEPFGGGLALLDYDGDGWIDVFCVQGGPFSPTGPREAPSAVSAVGGDRLFHNRGDGTFEDVTERAGIGRFPRGHGHGVAVGDIDLDGHADLFVTRWRSYALYRNRGDGTFEDVTDAWGLGGRRDWPTSAVLADLDGDGDPDLYVCHYAAWDLDNPRICRDPRTQAYLNCNPLDAAALPDCLFRNDGGRFVNVTAKAGIVDSDGRGLGVVATDLDGDGRVDLFVANDSSANFLFRNLGEMRFKEVGHLAGVASNASGTYQAGMGAVAGDLDGDGLIDLAVTNFYGESTTFYRNLSGGIFTDASASIGLTIASRRLLGFGLGLLDANNDGHLDMASANGHVNDLRPNYPYRMPAQLLLGGDDGRLRDVSDRAGSPWQVPRMGRGLAVGDLDNDGRQDVLILSHNQPLAYFHNQSDVGRFLVLCLEGRKSNCDLIGTRLTVISGGKRRVSWRVGGGSYQSTGDPRLHFGLGRIVTIDSLEVAWPSGRVDRYPSLRADTGYLLREGDDQPKPLKGFRSVGPSF